MGMLVSLVSSRHSRATRTSPSNQGLPQNQQSQQFSTPRPQHNIEEKLEGLDSLLRDVNSQLLSLSSSTSGVFFGKFRTKVDHLQKDWARILEAYRNQVWLAREMAGQGEAIATDFVDSYIPRLVNPNLPASTKILELQAYEKAAPEQAKNTKDLAQSFTKLSKQVNSIHTEWNTIASSHKLAARKGNGLNKVFAEIDAAFNVGAYDFNRKGVPFILQTLSSDALKGGDRLPKYLKRDGEPNPLDSGEVFTTLIAISYLSSALRVDMQRLRQNIEGNPKVLNQRVFEEELQSIQQVYQQTAVSLRRFQTLAAL